MVRESLIILAKYAECLRKRVSFGTRHSNITMFGQL
jgi:hypothetical protein